MPRDDFQDLASPDESSLLAHDRPRAIPDPVSSVPPPVSRDLYPPSRVRSKAKKVSKPGPSGGLVAWSVEQRLYEVIFSRNDSTYDVER